MATSVTMSEDCNQSQAPKHFRTLYLQGQRLPIQFPVLSPFCSNLFLLFKRPVPSRLSVAYISSFSVIIALPSRSTKVSRLSLTSHCFLPPQWP